MSTPISLGFRLQWGQAGSMTRSMRAADAVATAFDAGRLKADPGIGWPVRVEAALIAFPLGNLPETVALLNAGLGDTLPALLAVLTVDYVEEEPTTTPWNRGPEPMLDRS